MKYHVFKDIVQMRLEVLHIVINNENIRTVGVCIEMHVSRTFKFVKLLCYRNADLKTTTTKRNPWCTTSKRSKFRGVPSSVVDHCGESLGIVDKFRGSSWITVESVGKAWITVKAQQ